MQEGLARNAVMHYLLSAILGSPSGPSYLPGECVNTHRAFLLHSSIAATVLKVHEKTHDAQNIYLCVIPRLTRA